MANKNTKQKNAIAAKANRGNWPKSIFKAKSKPFPKGSSDGMTMAEQRKFFHGYI